MRRSVGSRTRSESTSQAIVALLALVLSVELVLSAASYLLAGLLHEGVVERTLDSLAFLLTVPDGMVSAWGVLLFGLVGLTATCSIAREVLRSVSAVASRPSVSDRSPELDPIAALQMRYADGELSDEQFERRLAHLLRSGEHGESSPENVSRDDRTE
ncbi:SHOCT domain-containing protein [Haloprofundus salinisoli]|uniref:SHOCT domain-containing protein n=1 Tax=Haloprofundus salinisoli TaxID=2876193 RepID=UPI001CCDEBBD|nr:SHOCT domain-containing protein [Haloprofundus salinisoli]